MQRRYTDNTTAGVLYPTDVITHVINIDSRFRNNPYSTPSTDFVIRLPKIYKNVSSFRLSSIEIPNLWYEFTKAKGNITFQITDFYGGIQTITIQEGNYNTIDDLASQVALQINTAYGYDGTSTGYTALVDNITSKLTITNLGSGSGSSQGPAAFTLVFPRPTNRPYDNGLGLYLGFTSTTYSGNIAYTAEGFGNVVGDNYFFVQVESFEVVESTTFADTAFSAFAKIIIGTPKNDIIFDNGNNLLTKTIQFSQPQNISQIRVKLINAYGDVILMSNNMSITVEVTEIVNSTLYETYRQRIPNNS